jgi:hypothetical protein
LRRSDEVRRVAICTNMPLTNIKGKRTRLESIMTLEGLVLAADAGTDE